MPKSSDKLTKKQKEKLALEAMIEFGDRALYEVRKGTRGMGLFAYADTKEDSSILRNLIPMNWKMKIYTIHINHVNSNRRCNERMLSSWVDNNP